jgi:phage terminase large subunit-like protein
MSRVVVAIDPAVTSGEDADETGIVVAGKDAEGHGYVLADHSGRYTPIEWATKAIEAYHKHEADRIVAEVNNGGEMVEATICRRSRVPSYFRTICSKNASARLARFR